MQAALDALMEKIRNAQENGESIGVSWLLQEERYSSLLGQITAQRDAYAPWAAAATTTAQRAAVETAAKAAENWTYLSVGARGIKQAAAVGVVWNKLPADRLEAYVGLAGDGSPLRNLFTSVSTDRANDVRDILFSGIGSGESAASIAKRLQTVSDVSAARARLIARTEVNRAHRTAAIESYRNNAGIIDGWIWRASCDTRTCTACWAMHGSWHSSNEPFGSHPACFIAGTIVDTPAVLGSSTRWYEGEVVEVQTVSGNRFTVTPNHPILTPQGWVAAGLLHKGGHVIRSLSADRILSAVDPDNDHVPARIEDVAESFGGAGSMTFVSVPTTTEDFHGDGAGSEVCIIRTDSLLANGVNAALGKHLAEESFAFGTGVPSGFDGESHFTAMLDGTTPATPGSIGGSGEEFALFRCSHCGKASVGFDATASLDAMVRQDASDDTARHAELLGNLGLELPLAVSLYNRFLVDNSGSRTIVADSNIGFSENTVDHFEGDVVGASELLARLSSLVATDEIIEVRRKPFSGHVYNLQTATGWYIANGIVAHNCRCSAVPSVRDLRTSPDQKDVRPRVQLGPDRFEDLTDAEKKEILGDALFAKYKKGEIKLSDTVHTTTSPRWGVTRKQATVAQADANAGSATA